MGNPHVVIDDPGGPDADLIARAVALADGLDAGANVEFVTVLDRPTTSRSASSSAAWASRSSCGTGSCATAAVAHRLGLVADRVTVTNPGGDLDVTLDGRTATLAGPAVRIATIALAEPW